MRVLCTRLPVPVDGMEISSSPWVTIDREYIVLGVLAEFGGRIKLHLLTDDGQSLGWFAADCFRTVEGAIPASWAAQVGQGGTVELGPQEWLVDGFWESYYDGDPSARSSVEHELTVMRAGEPN